MAERTYLLVDGNNVLSRAAHKARTVDLSVNGVDTATLLFFVNMLAKYVRLVGPTHVLVCWDSGHVFRSQIYPQYKADRGTAADAAPLRQAKQFLTLAGVPHRARPGWEADDLIALTVRTVSGAKVILSGDRDLLQMLDEDTVQYRLLPGEDQPWDADRFEAEFGYPPAQMPYVKALMGDRGDNVPGLRGVGPVKAVRMLTEAGWDWAAVRSSLTEEDRDIVALTLRLVDLRYLDYRAEGLLDPPSCPPFTPTGPQDLLWRPLEDLLAGLEMSTVLDRLQASTLWSQAAEDPSQTVPVALLDQGREAFLGVDFG